MSLKAITSLHSLKRFEGQSKPEKFNKPHEMTSWINPLSKKSSLTPSGKSMLGHGFLDHQDERRLEMTYVGLMELEETSTKLYKEVRDISKEP